MTNKLLNCIRAVLIPLMGVELFLGSCLVSGQGASANIPPPSPPFVTIPPLPVAWKVSYDIKAKPSGSNPSKQELAMLGEIVSQVQTSQVGGLTQQLVTYSNGSASERWFASDCFLSEDPATQQIHLLSHASAGDPFHEFSWIDLSHYVGVETKEGKLCYAYAAPISDPFLPPGTFARKPGSPATHGLKAWIEVKSKLPVALDQGFRTGTYTMLPPPSSLALPARFAEVLAAHQRQLDSPDQHKMKF